MYNLKMFSMLSLNIRAPSLWEQGLVQLIIVLSGGFLNYFYKVLFL